MNARPVLVATRAACVFAGVVVALISLARGPLDPRDYLVVGVVATLASMALLFRDLTSRP